MPEDVRSAGMECRKGVGRECQKGIAKVPEVNAGRVPKGNAGMVPEVLEGSDIHSDTYSPSGTSCKCRNKCKYITSGTSDISSKCPPSYQLLPGIGFSHVCIDLQYFPETETTLLGKIADL